MKFVCGHCKAKYQLADEKVAGRTLRMTCRSCGREILIRSDPTQKPTPVPPAPPPPPAVALSIPSPLAARSSLTSVPRVATVPTSFSVPQPLGARSSLTGAPRHAPPPPPSPLGADFRAAAAQPAPPAAIGPPDEWHVAIDDVPLGPIHREEVARKIAAGALGPDSLAWREGLDDWMPIHDIPELMVLCQQAGGAAPVPMPAAAPTIGGRAGAAPGFAVQDWSEVSVQLAPPASGSSPSHAAPSGLTDPDLAALRGTQRGPSLPLLFAVACGGALVMSVVAILGARFLAKDNAAQVAATQPVAPAAPSAPVPEAPARENVIELEEQVLDQPLTEKSRSGGAARPTTTSTKPKKELTEAQKAMLARMGGEGADLSGLQHKATESTGPARGGGSLTAQELSGVINRNKKQLQRCYETAARGAGSDDTVRLDVSITVAPSGGVSSVQLSGNGLPGMADCIERSVRGWRFPSSGEPVTTRFPLLFQPGA